MYWFDACVLFACTRHLLVQNIHKYIFDCGTVIEYANEAKLKTCLICQINMTFGLLKVFEFRLKCADSITSYYRIESKRDFKCSTFNMNMILTKEEK